MFINEYRKSTIFYILFTFATFIVSPILALYLSEIGLTNIQLGLFFAITPLMLIFTIPILGKISDDIGREFIIFWALIAEIFALLIYFVSDSVSWLLIVARILDAIAVMTITMLSVVTIEDKIDDNTSRGKYTGLSFSLQYLGRIVAPIIAGFIADYFFIRLPFIISILFMVGLLAFIPKNSMLNRKKFSKRDFSLIADLKEFLSFRKLRGMALLGFVKHAVNPIFTIFLPLYIVNELGLSYAYVGYALFAMGLGHILQYWFGKIADKKAYLVVLGGTFISGFFLFCMSRVESYVFLVIFLFLKGIGDAMWNISAWTLMSGIGEEEHLEGEIIGSYISIAKIGSLLSFIISGFFVTQFGITSLFALNGIIIIIGTFLAYPFLKN